MVSSSPQRQQETEPLPFIQSLIDQLLRHKHFLSSPRSAALKTTRFLLLRELKRLRQKHIISIMFYTPKYLTVKDHMTQQQDVVQRVYRFTAFINQSQRRFPLISSWLENLTKYNDVVSFISIKQHKTKLKFLD